MINYNGKIIEGIEPNLLNRGFLYGDCAETRFHSF